MTRSTRPVRLYMLTDQRNAHLRPATLDVTGRAANGSAQGTWVVAARTKVRAAEIASEAFSGPVRAGALRMVGSDDAGDHVRLVVRARLIAPQEWADGTALCWRREFDGDPIVRYQPGRPDDHDVVARWRRRDTDAGHGTVPVPVGTDPELRPSRTVMLPAPTATGVYAGNGITRDEYPGGVHVRSDGTLWVAGIGRASVCAATEIMQALAAGLAEIERRESES